MIQKTVQKTVEYTVYEATDGTQFDSINECLQYESSAIVAVKSVYSTFVIKQIEENDILPGGSDNTVDIVMLPTLESVKLVMQMFTLVNDVTPDKDVLNILQRSYDEKDPVLIEWNSGFSRVWVLNTKEQLIKNICNICSLEDIA